MNLSPDKYKTFYIGSSLDIENSPLIALGKSRDLNGTISLENLSSILEGVTLIFVPKNQDGLFQFINEDKKRHSFDLIIYYSEEENGTPIGYTRFSEEQRLYGISGTPFEEVLISIKFEREEYQGDVVIEVKNDYQILNDQEKVNLPKAKYQTPEETYLRFTNKIVDFKNDETLSILTDAGSFYRINSEIHGTSLVIEDGGFIDTGTYTNYLLGVCKGDLVVVGHDEETGFFSVFSLTHGCREFGRYIVKFYGTVEGECSLYHISDSLIYFKDKEENYIVWDVDKKETTKILEPTEGIRVLDKRDYTGNVRYLSYQELFQEIKSTCILPEGFSLSAHKYVDKVGSWWVLEKDGEYYYTSPFGYFGSDKKPEMINERLFLKNNTFYSIAFGETEATKEVEIDSGTTWENLEKDKEIILDGLRRKPIRSEKCFPKKILGSLFGMIFYIENDRLYCY